MTGMTTAPEQARPSGARPAARRMLACFTVPLAGTALAGLLAGLIWGEAAPRALLQEVGSGTAQLVNAETTAFIAADAWFCAIGAAAGLLTGLLGYRFGIAARTGNARAAVAAGLILGAAAGAFVMLWLGEQIGLSGYDQHLTSSPDGTLFHASLALGAKSALAFWPMFTSIVILVAEWGGRRGGDSARPAAPPGPELTQWERG